MAEERYFRVRITTPRLASQGKVLVYVAALDEGQQRDCAAVSRDHGYGEADMMVVAAIKNVTTNLPHGEGEDELIPVSVKEIPEEDLRLHPVEIMRKKN